MKIILCQWRKLNLLKIQKNKVKKLMKILNKNVLPLTKKRPLLKKLLLLPKVNLPKISRLALIQGRRNI